MVGVTPLCVIHAFFIEMASLENERLHSCLGGRRDVPGSFVASLLDLDIRHHTEVYGLWQTETPCAISTIQKDFLLTAE
jgi:hypothetical protein